MKQNVLATCGAALFLLSATVIADDVWKMDAKAKQLGLISVEQAKAAALAAKPGIIDDIDLENRRFGGGWDYELEIIDRDGREWDVYVNAVSGEVRRVKRDWDWF